MKDKADIQTYTSDILFKSSKTYNKANLKIK